jgi:hypothetical protein
VNLHEVFWSAIIAAQVGIVITNKCIVIAAIFFNAMLILFVICSQNSFVF